MRAPGRGEDSIEGRFGRLDTTGFWNPASKILILIQAI